MTQERGQCCNCVPNCVPYFRKQTKTNKNASRAEARTPVRNGRQRTRRLAHRSWCRSCVASPLDRRLPRRLGSGSAAWTVVARDRRAGSGSVARSRAVVTVARAFVVCPSLHALGVCRVILLVGVYAALYIYIHILKQKGE